MGYCIDQRGCKFFIDKSNVENVKNVLKKHMPEFSHGSRKNFDDMSIEELFEDLRWQIDFDDFDNINYIFFIGEKSWDEFEVLSLISEYVKDGSYIEMSGEDGSMWRWVFDGKNVKEIYPEIKWE